jgi:flagellin-like protein
MKKGISAIIATILLLLITIALAGTAYMFTSGFLEGRTKKSISVLTAECVGDDITVVVSNDGLEDVSVSELSFIIDSTDRSTNFRNGFSTSTINPHQTAVGIDNTTSYGSGVHNILVTSPSNTAQIQVYCS